MGFRRGKPSGGMGNTAASAATPGKPRLTATLGGETSRCGFEVAHVMKSSGPVTHQYRWIVRTPAVEHHRDSADSQAPGYGLRGTELKGEDIGLISEQLPAWLVNGEAGHVLGSCSARSRRAALAVGDSRSPRRGTGARRRATPKAAVVTASRFLKRVRWAYPSPSRPRTGPPCPPRGETPCCQPWPVTASTKDAGTGALPSRHSPVRHDAEELHRATDPLERPAANWHELSRDHRPGKLPNRSGYQQLVGCRGGTDARGDVDRRADIIAAYGIDSPAWTPTPTAIEPSPSGGTSEAATKSSPQRTAALADGITT